MPRRALSLGFYNRDVVLAAHDLLGKILVRRASDGVAAGRIVEVEAYLAHNDPACHAARGRTRRNATMFGPAGRAYVYAIHSRYCVNVVTEREDVPSAVLIRAIEPLSGRELMQRRRGTDKPLDLARGPGRLCEAMAIDKALDGHDLTLGERLWIEADDDSADAGIADDILTATDSLRRHGTIHARDAATKLHRTSSRSMTIGTSPRIGVTSAQELPLRFYIEGSPFVSRRTYRG